MRLWLMITFFASFVFTSVESRDLDVYQFPSNETEILLQSCDVSDSGDVLIPMNELLVPRSDLYSIKFEIEEEIDFDLAYLSFYPSNHDDSVESEALENGIELIRLEGSVHYAGEQSFSSDLVGLLPEGILEFTYFDNTGFVTKAFCQRIVPGVGSTASIGNALGGDVDAAFFPRSGDTDGNGFVDRGRLESAKTGLTAGGCAVNFDGTSSLPACMILALTFVFYLRIRIKRLQRPS